MSHSKHRRSTTHLDYKVMQNQMDQVMSRSNSFVNSLQFKGLNVIGQQSSQNQCVANRESQSSSYMNDINRQLQNVYIKQQLLNNQGYGRRQKVFKPRCTYAYDVHTNPTDNIGKQIDHNLNRQTFRQTNSKNSRSQSNMKWTYRDSFQEDKQQQQEVDKEPLIRKLINQKIKQDNQEYEDIKKWKKNKQEQDVEGILDDDSYDVLKIMMVEKQEDEIVLSKEQKKEGLLILIDMIRRIEECQPKQYVHKMIEQVMKINNDFLQQIAGSYKQYQQDTIVDLYKWLVLNYKFDIGSVYSKQFTEQADLINQKQYALNNELKKGKVNGQVGQKGLSMIGQSTMKGEIRDPNVIYEKLRKTYQFIDKKPMLLKSSKYDDDYKKQNQGAMKFKGSYQKSILEGLQLNNCTSYKKDYRNRQMDNEEMSAKYGQKRDGLSPMKSLMPLEDTTIQKSHFVKYDGLVPTKKENWTINNLELLQQNGYMNQYQTVSHRDYQKREVEMS